MRTQPAVTVRNANRDAFDRRNLIYAARPGERP